jgi:ABC-type oligopeptide transport system ATPase subunit
MIHAHLDFNPTSHQFSEGQRQPLWLARMAHMTPAM